MEKRPNKEHDSLLKNILFIGLPIAVIINTVITIYIYIVYLK